MAVTVLIVDDHDGFRAQAKQLLASAGYAVVGEAADVATARTAAKDLGPDVVLLDVQLPDGNGFDVAEELSPSAKVVMISGRDPAMYRRQLRKTSAVGFIPKSSLSRAALAELLAGS